MALPTFEEIRRNARRLLGDAEQELRSDRRGGPLTLLQREGLHQALSAIRQAKDALDRAAP